MKTASEWLNEAKWDLDPQIRLAVVKALGYDKADEMQAALERIATNLLDTLDTLKMSQTTFLKLLAAISSITVDNYFPEEARRGRLI